jgi:hypothetical protein
MKPGRKPGSADPGTEKPQWSAERRPRSPKEDAATRKTGAPLGAPSPRLFAEATKGPRESGDEDGEPGAAQIIRAMALGCLIIESVTCAERDAVSFPSPLVGEGGIANANAFASNTKNGQREALAYAER